MSRKRGGKAGKSAVPGGPGGPGGPGVRAVPESGDGVAKQSAIRGAGLPGAGAEARDVAVVDVIRAIQSKELAPEALSVDQRLACVGYLMCEGYSAAETAGILRVSDRTVMRDRARVRELGAVEAGPSLLAEMVGRLMLEAELTVQRLRKLGRDKETPASARVDAERGAWDVTRDLIGVLQRLGYLPTAITRVRADLTHRLDEQPPEYDELREEMERVEAIRAGCRIADPAADEGIGRVKDALIRLSAGQQLRALAAQVKDKGKEATSHGA